MNISDWQEVYKLSNEGNKQRSNVVYVPLVNQSGDIFCMDFGNKDIEFDNNFFFLRELEFLDKFKQYSWAPNILEIDKLNKRIYISWNKNTCNNIIYTNQSINKICPDWKNQLKKIVKDILSEKVYKMTLYPHCFYVDSDQTLRTIDFYGCVIQTDSNISLDTIKNLITYNSKHRWEEALNDGKIDFEIFFQKAIEVHINEWPDIKLKKLIYE
jgi:hypothetical protein